MFDWSNIREIFGLLESLATILGAGGLLLVFFQMKEARRFSRSQIVSELDSNFVDHHQKTHNQLISDPGWPNENDETAIGDCLLEISFFERLGVLLESESIEIEVIRGMFTYRFFTIVNNPVVQKKAIYTGAEDYFYPLFYLHHRMSNAVNQAGMIIPNAGTDLSKFKPDHYKRMVGSLRKRTIT